MIPRRPSSASAARAGSRRRRRGSRRRRRAERRRGGSASGEAMTSTGDWSRVRRSCESSGSRAWRVEDDAGAAGGRRRARAVSSGSSASDGADPDGDRVGFGAPAVDQRAARARRRSRASRRARSRCAPSSDIASFRVDQRQPGAGVLAEGLVEQPGGRRLGAGGELDLDAAVAEDPRARGPAAFSVGSSEAITTRAIPASRIASVQGGWRPWWAQGSSVTYIVAPAGSSPRARQSSSAARSACRPPSSAWKPSPITSPSRTTTAPTSGFGLTRPRPPSASSSARRRWSPDPWLSAGRPSDRLTGQSTSLRPSPSGAGPARRRADTLTGQHEADHPDPLPQRGGDAAGDDRRPAARRSTASTRSSCWSSTTARPTAPSRSPASRASTTSSA